MLSPREREVAKLLRGGLTQSEIAARLGISIRTVETHAANIRAKTGQPTSAVAAFHARVRARPRAVRGEVRT